MATLILLRHGKSQWNERNLFTGWVDVPLTPTGIEEALQAGDQIRDMPIDIVYTSTLIRAQMTAMLALADHGSGRVPVMQQELVGEQAGWNTIHNEKTVEQTIPVMVSWHLNERMYGELQGSNKAETVEKFGKEQVHIWRRSFDTPPPKGESLKMTAERTLPYFDDKIIPHLQAGRNVLISAHGNSLRSIAMELDELSAEEVLKLEIPTGKPIFYEYVDGRFEKKSDA